MQEDVENRTVNLVITTTKLTARTLAVVCRKYCAARRNHKIKKQNKRPVGKQTVKQLIGQNQGVQSIPIAATDIKGFERYARKYGVDFAIKKDLTEQPPKYLVFFKARDNDALTAAFKEYSASVLGINQKKKSVLKELNKLKQLSIPVPGKVKEKIQEIGR